jgi:TonB family protein
MEEKSIKSKPEAQYTKEARQHQIVGSVLLRGLFHSSGQIKDVCVVQGLPYGLTRQAVQAAYKIKFEPVMKDGHPVSVTRYIEYNFSLY